MKAKTKFMKMYYKMPEKARGLVHNAYGDVPMTLNVICLEVRRYQITNKIRRSI